MVTLWQSMTLPSPSAVTPQRWVSWHKYWEFGPMMAPHETVLWHEALQPAPHEAVQSFMSWQSGAQLASHTAPQRTWFSHVGWQPEPLHER